MQAWLMMFSVAVVFVSVQACASTPEELLKKHNCLACHAVETKMVGPSYKQVAAKYKGQDVVARLMDKVTKGGSGNFGPVPMSPNPLVPDADLKVMLRWILAR
ncbi:c-type cytochrome [Laribacter hongkongensis]|uniref:Cytochrome c class I NirM n=1 Tax=Laribacter hongkongensis TaxID=168471 RepID=A0A248LJ13_9NEIS|nr:c-type cytochrome [Laribacter hongkongensis]ASJ24356.1 cytochrome c class I NirM [Laribacter hongkongensis]MCG9042040.1 cytochrome C [Laribacter hongkongensis]MCG9053919.1 cytochrome C [Laribacter hongkongensis]MCG9069076.1 cytochrome C [Laribacter hongkongensis]MCG9083883.1 cytochrome C [Laribacter hongkongensis]